MKNVFRLFFVFVCATPCQANGLGRAWTFADERTWDLPIGPEGQNLPKGRGRAAEGQVVYMQFCASCHGSKMEGGNAFHAPTLTGGRGTLTTTKPKKTVESYWPYATTLFDYVRRAMPMTSPGVLSDDQVYAVTAYILAEAKVIDANQVLNQQTLPKVQMPNRDGFISQWR